MSNLETRSFKKPVDEKLYRAVKRLINQDNPDLDFSNRHGFIVSCMIDNGDTAAIMHYKLDPDSDKCETITDLDEVGLTLHMAHKMQPDLWDHLVEKIAPLSQVKKVIDKLFA